MFWERLRDIFVGNTFNSSDYIPLMRQQLMNDLEKMRKAAEIYFRALSQYLPGGTRETLTDLSNKSWSLGQDFNSESHKYKT
jgi:hypothetical protein